MIENKSVKWEEGQMSGWGRAKGEGRGLMSKGGFKELRVWQKGKDLAVYIYRITKRNI